MFIQIIIISRSHQRDVDIIIYCRGLHVEVSTLFCRLSVLVHVYTRYCTSFSGEIGIFQEQIKHSNNMVSYYMYLNNFFFLLSLFLILKTMHGMCFCSKRKLLM